MPNWKNLLIYLGIAVLALFVGGLVVGVLFTHFLVDWWWFDALNFEPYFWLRLLYRYILSGGVTLCFFLIFFLNFWVASNYLGVDETEFSLLAKSPEGSGYQRLLHRFQTGSMQVYLPLSVVLATIIAAPFYQHWEDALLFFFGPSAAAQDPIFAKNISFYLFSFPLFKLIQDSLLWTFALLSIAMAVLYWIEHRVVPTEHREWPKEARIHLTGLVVVALLIVCWGFMLERYALLYTNHHGQVFFGPGLVEMDYHLPLIWLNMLSFLGATLAWLYQLNQGRGLKAAGVFGAVFLLSLGLHHSDFIPHLLEKYVVEPNPVDSEREHMQANIDATLDAFNLKDVKFVNFDLATDLGAEIERMGPALEQHLANIPVWDEDLLDEAFQQLQGIRSYYRFSSVDVGRYSIRGRLQQVDLAAREVNIDKLPDAARNWENRHLRFTHGYGVVVIPAAQRGEEPMQWYLKDLEQQSSVGLAVKRPDIYYGQENLDYAIVPNKLDAVEISTSEPDGKTDYRAQGGVPIDSLFRKLIYAVKHRDEKIFFSGNIGGDSRMLSRRNIVERIKTLAPFLEVDNDPYVAITPDRVYWIQDAYTLSNHYPVAKSISYPFKAGATEKQSKTFNYIRNSVKVLVDAYDGTTQFYISDPADPIIQAYRRAYPGLFKDVGEMPPLLREQLRYPRDLFALQMQIYARYHQTNPDQFYQQSETWDFARNIGAEPVRPMQPYYLTVDTQDCPNLQKFVLISPMTPVGRDNLSVLALAGPTEKADCTGLDYSGKVVIYKFPQKQIDGPAQISALIDQDPVIREQFTLWDQRGSRVKRGRTIILPIGHAVVYVQPVYISASTTTKIPELVRVIVSMGTEVVMDRSLDAALKQLIAQLKAHKSRQLPVNKTSAPEPGVVSSPLPQTMLRSRQP
ncbi:MAG: UPF0182 family protein [Methylococcaceae bacterium]|nr:MAG: UPF0182 family protein [Methylococcaceae bacterium]